MDYSDLGGWEDLSPFSSGLILLRKKQNQKNTSGMEICFSSYLRNTDCKHGTESWQLEKMWVYPFASIIDIFIWTAKNIPKNM